MPHPRMRWLVLLLFVGVAGAPVSAQTADTVTVGGPALVLSGVPFAVTVNGLDATAMADTRVRVGAQTFPLEAGEDGALVAPGVVASARGETAVEVVRGGAVIGRAETRTIPGWLSVFPPLIAIVVALLFRRVIPALFLGVWVGAVLVAGLSLGGVGEGLFDTLQVYILSALADEGHAAIILFSLMIGGMVGIIQKNGGTQGIVDRIVGWASTPKRGQLSAAVLGLVIFFDDYANSLIIGPTMRPVTDRLRISREKLAYIVDSTSAPVASLALVTTWIGFEVGLINEAIAQIPTLSLDGYSVFLESILYRFYPVLALFFVFVIAFTDREFGPMYDAEHRARTTGAVLGAGAKVDEAAAEGAEFVPPEGKPRRAMNAILPVLVLVVGVIVGLFVTGEGTSIRDIIGSADSYKALMWASLAGVLTAVALSVGQRILTLDETMDAWYAGLKSMLFAMIILLLAWALSATTDALHTGAYLGSALSEALPPGLVPALIFVLAALTAFATGTSWGTMGILMPLVVPLTWGVMQANGIADPDALLPPLLSRLVRPRRGRLGRPLLADLGHDDPLLDGLRLRPHRARPHPASVRAPRRHGRHRTRDGADGLRLPVVGVDAARRGDVAGRAPLLGQARRRAQRSRRDRRRGVRDARACVFVRIAGDAGGCSGALPR